MWTTGDDSALARWEARARRAAAAPGWWGRWRRKRAMKAFVSAASPEVATQLPAWAGERPVTSDLLDRLADVTDLERQARELIPAQLTHDEEAVRRARADCAETRAELSIAVHGVVGGGSQRRALSVGPATSDAAAAQRDPA
jgi:hypothetical protein